MNQIDRLFGHDRDMTIHLLSLCDGLSDEELDRDFDIGHRTLRETFGHMIIAVNMWTKSMIGESTEWDRPLRSLAELRSAHESSYRLFESLGRQIIADDKLDDTFEDPWNNRHSFGSTILHVILHNHVHRSDVLHILQRLGSENLPEGDPQEWEWQLRADSILPPA